MVMLIDTPMEAWKCRKNSVGYLLGQVFSWRSSDRTRELGTLDLAMNSKKRRPFLKGDFLWVVLWKQLRSIHSFQRGWLLAERAEALGLISVSTAKHNQAGASRIKHGSQFSQSKYSEGCVPPMALHCISANNHLDDGC